MPDYLANPHISGSIYPYFYRTGGTKIPVSN